MIADEDDILRLAAGDREALFLLGCNVLEGSIYEYPITDAERFAKAEGFARLAVVHGNPQDLVLLGCVMAARSRVAETPEAYDHCRNEALEAFRAAMEAGHPEGAVRLAYALTTAADNGDELASVQLLDLMNSVGPAEAARLKDTVAEWLSAKPVLELGPQADALPAKPVEPVQLMGKLGNINLAHIYAAWERPSPSLQSHRRPLRLLIRTCAMHGPC